MSRSKKDPTFYIISKKCDKDIDHGRVRAAIRAELQKPIDEQDLCIIEGDMKEVIGEDYGTKLDVVLEEQEKESRK